MDCDTDAAPKKMVYIEELESPTAEHTPESHFDEWTRMAVNKSKINVTQGERVEWLQHLLSNIKTHPSRTESVSALIYLIHEGALDSKATVLDVFCVSCLKAVAREDSLGVWDAMGDMLDHDFVIYLVLTVLSGWETLGVECLDALKALDTIMRRHVSHRHFNKQGSSRVKDGKNVKDGYEKLLRVLVTTLEKRDKHDALRLQLILLLLKDLKQCKQYLEKPLIVQLLYTLASHIVLSYSIGREVTADCIAALANLEEMEVPNLVKKYTLPLLDEFIRPNFRTHPTVPTGTLADEKKRLRQRPEEEVDRLRHEFHENQTWKKNHTVEIVDWLLKTVDSVDVQQLPRFIPVILTLLDDYESQYRLKGVEMLKMLVSKSDGQDLRETGVLQVFQKSLSDCASYQSDVALMDSALETLIELVPILWRVPEKRYEAWRDILLDTVLYMLSMTQVGRGEVLNVLLQHAIQLTRKLDVLAVRFMPTMLEQASDVMVSSRDVEVQLVAAQLILALTETCQERVWFYRDLILASCAEAWTNSAQVSAEELRRVIVVIVQRLKKSCDTAHVTFDELHLLSKLDAEFYKDIINA
jgi:hypothetical protein